MSVNLNSVSRDRSLASFLEKQSSPAAMAQAAGFEQQLVSAIRDSLSQVGLDPQQVQVSLTSSRGVSGTGASQILVTVTQPAVQVRGATETSAAGAQSNGAGGSATAPSDPVQILKEALKVAGLDPDRFSLAESREVVGYPGGSYVNHVITAELGAGVRGGFGVELMLRNPQLTVLEIQRALSSVMRA